MIQETKTSIVYVGDGVQTSFPFPYRYRDKKDIVGYIEKDGTWTRITGNYEYHDGEKRYEYPTTGAPLGKGARLKLVRETPRSQEQDFGDARIESAFDKITMILQEMGVGVAVGEFGGLIPSGRPFAFLRFNADATRLEVVDLPDWQEHERVVLAARRETLQDADDVRRLKENVATLYKNWREKQTQAGQELDRHVEVGRTALDERARHKLEEITSAGAAQVGEIKAASNDAKSVLRDAHAAGDQVRRDTDTARADLQKIAQDAVSVMAQKGEEVNVRLEDAKGQTARIEAAVSAGTSAVKEMARYKDLPAEMAQAKSEYDAKIKAATGILTSAQQELENVKDTAHQIAGDSRVAQEAMTKAVNAAAGAFAAESATRAAAKNVAADAASALRAATEVLQAESRVNTAAQGVQDNAQQAAASARAASADAQTANEQARAANTAQVGATQQANLAKKYADEAAAIAGGDVLTQTKADARYLKKTDKIDAYTKAESDMRYAGKSSLVGLATTAYVDAAAAAVVKGAPEALDTLEELAKALGDDPNFASTMAKELGKKADRATVENALLGKADKEEMTRALATKADATALAGKADADAVYTKQQADGKLSTVQDAVTQAATETIRQTTYTKSESDGRYQAKGSYLTAADISGYITETKADGKYQPKGNYAVSTNVYTKTEAGNKFQPKGAYLTKNDVYTSTNRIKLPNGTEIGVE